jgi:hypothetical protein
MMDAMERLVRTRSNPDGAGGPGSPLFSRIVECPQASLLSGEYRE